jgi:hypothetical protein
METKPACQYVQDGEQDQGAPAPEQQPWTFNPTVPQPMDLTVPLPGPAPGQQANPYLQTVPPLPGTPPPSTPSPAPLFPNQGPDVPTIPSPLGPVQIMPWVHAEGAPFDNLPDGPEKPTQHAPIPDGN